MEMFLPLRCYALHERLVAQCAGSSENRLGNFDLIIKRQRSDGLGWRLIDRCKLLGKPYARRCLDFCNEFSQNIVIQIELVGRVMPDVLQKKLGYAMQHRAGFS